MRYYSEQYADRALRPDADTRHMGAEDWYQGYGAHVSTRRCGDVEVQYIAYADAVPERREAVVDELRDDGLTRAEAEQLHRLACEVREAADAVAYVLGRAVAAYKRGDRDAVLRCLDEASDIETEHGDDPATQALAERLCAPAPAD